MSRRATWLLLFAGIALHAEVNVPIATDPGSNVTIKVTSPAATVPHFGFMPLHLSVENGTVRDGVWRFRFESGNRGTFPGVITSTFELAVPSPQTREAWFFVPLAEPGIAVDPSALAPPITGSTSSITMPSAPPPIPGVYPDPKTPGVSHSVRSTITPSAMGLGRTFTITQTGPASALPMLPRDKLPPQTTMSLTPANAAGEVTRTTVVTVAVGRTGSGGTVSGGGTFSSGGMTFVSGSGSPSMTAMNNARNALSAAGFTPSGIGLRSSSQTRPGTKPGTNDVTVIFTQVGPEAMLPLPPVSALPKGFTDVNVTPVPNSTDVTRTFTYAESVLLPTNVPTALPAFPAGRTGLLSTSSTVAEAEARKILAPTKLLQPAASVKTVASVQLVSVSGLVSGGAGGVYPLVTFDQTGPAAALPPADATSLPPGVKVRIFPAPDGVNTLRVITVIDPAVIAALYAAAAAPTSTTVTSQNYMLARIELQRSGLLRSQGSSISQGMSQRYSSGTPRPGGPDIYIFTESGPANLLPPIPPAALPAGITCTITAGPLPGEQSRNFVVNMPAFTAGLTGTTAAGTPGATAGGSAGPIAMRFMASGNTAPGTLVVEVSGPGLLQPQRIVFPNAISNTAMPPIATTPALESVLRVKFAATGMRSLPNVSAFDPALVPADWRVWSSFNTVVLRAEYFAALDAARRGALHGWVSLGGVLVLLPEQAGTARTDTLGAGRIETLAQPLAEIDASNIVAQLQLTSAAPGMPERDRAHFGPGSPMGDLVQFDAPNMLWLSLFLVAFAALIGPVNLFLFAPAAKRHRLFFTTPLISAAGALAVAGAILMQDGAGGHGLRRALVVLVPGENQAAVFQEQAARSGFLTGRGFALDDAVLCAVLPTDATMPYPNVLFPGAFSRATGRADGDWFRNRSRQAHLLRQLVPTRARIELLEPAADGAPVIESTVATELKDFRLRDDRGNYWFAASVVAGRRIPLKADARFAAASAASQAFNGNGTDNFGGLLNAVTLRAPWQWFARGGATDLAPIATLPTIRWQDDDITYAGVAEPAASVAKRPAKGVGQ